MKAAILSLAALALSAGSSVAAQERMIIPPGLAGPLAGTMPRVAALGNIRAAANLGGFVGILKTSVLTSPFDSLTFELSYGHDVGSAHKSSIISPKIQ